MTELLLLLADGRFPAGGHAHSGGVEAAVAAGDVDDLATLGDFLHGKLVTAGAVDGWAAATTCAGADPDAVEAEYEARSPSPALRAAGRAQGRGLKRTAARSWPAAAVLAAEQHAVVLGCVAGAAGLSPEQAAALAIHSLLMGGAAAAVRLLPIDMADAAAVVAGLAPVAERIARESATSPDRPAWSAPALELRAEEHARWEVRLFAS
jgi:urease accessory protein